MIFYLLLKALLGLALFGTMFYGIAQGKTK